MPILLFILQNPGKVYSLLTMVFELVSSGVDWIDVQKKLAEMRSALSKAEKSKDTTDAEKIFNP